MGITLSTWSALAEVRQPQASCIVCGRSGEFQPTLRILQQCPECSFIFADTAMTEADIARLYGPGYFSGEEYSDYVQDRHVHTRSFRRKIRFIRRVAPDLRRVFEIGCAYGFFLDAAESHWEAAGIDVAVDAVKYAREVLHVDARSGDFLDLPISSGYYDAFCMWDTVEHLARPDAYLARIRELIRPGGFLFLSTGDIGSRAARRAGASWRLIHPPTHLSYFSRQTISGLLKRYGFEVKTINTMGVHRSVRQTFYSLFVMRQPKLKWLYQLVSESRIGALPYYLNLGDIMIVGAQAGTTSQRGSLVNGSLEC